MKDYIKKAIADGVKYEQIIDDINAEIVSQILIKTRGNQTEAAKLLNLHRSTLRNYIRKSKS